MRDIGDQTQSCDGAERRSVKRLMFSALLIALAQLSVCGCTGEGESGAGAEITPEMTPEMMMDASVESAPTWEIEASFDEMSGTVMSVWGASSSDGWMDEMVWAVGGQPSQGRLWSRIGDQWSEDEVPDGPLLNWVHGARGHLWVVGNEGRAIRKVSLAEGGSGAWEVVDTGITQDLWGVWVSAPDEVWAVGGDPIGDGEPDPVLARFDGESWSRVAIPELDRGGVRALFKIYGDRERGEVFAVGMKGVIIGDTGAGWAQRSVEPAGDTPVSAEDLVSLWRTEEGFVAVGGRSNGVVARWDGAAWSALIQAGVPGLNGVWVDAQERVTAVGVRGAAIALEPGSFDGARERTGTQLVLHATWGRAGELWAVGGSLDSSPPWEGVILRRALPQ